MSKYQNHIPNLGIEHAKNIEFNQNLKTANCLLDKYSVSALYSKTVFAFKLNVVFCNIVYDVHIVATQYYNC